MSNIEHPTCKLVFFLGLVQANVEAAGEGGGHEPVQESLDLQKLQVSKPQVSTLTHHVKQPFLTEYV